MRQNSVQLEKFYASKRGIAANHMINRRLNSVWADLSGKEVLGFGYTSPFLKLRADQAKRLIFAQPSMQGGHPVMSEKGNMACVVHEVQLPFSDASFDYALIAHGLEESGDRARFLQEVWRVMKPEGRIIIVCANRTGLWARADGTPFGAGRPYSRPQLRKLLRGSRFEPTLWAGALYTFPTQATCHLTLSNFFEQVGETIWTEFSGVILVEAVKRLYARTGGARERTRVSRPVFSPNPVSHSRTHLSERHKP